MYEQALPGGLSPSAFRGQAIVDISDTIDLKIQSVLAHESQVQNFTEQWIEGIKGRAAYMGFRINVKYAEAFEVVKHIMRFWMSIRVIVIYKQFVQDVEQCMDRSNYSEGTMTDYIKHQQQENQYNFRHLD